MIFEAVAGALWPAATPVPVVIAIENYALHVMAMAQMKRPTPANTAYSLSCAKQ